MSFAGWWLPGGEVWASRHWQSDFSQGGEISIFWQFCHPVSSKLWMLKVHWRVWAQPGAGLLQESGAGRAGGRPRGPWLALPGKAKVLDSLSLDLGRCKLPHFRLLDSPPATCFWSSTPSQVLFFSSKIWFPSQRNSSDWSFCTDRSSLSWQKILWEIFSISEKKSDSSFFSRSFIAICCLLNPKILLPHRRHKVASLTI